MSCGCPRPCSGSIHHRLTCPSATLRRCHEQRGGVRAHRAHGRWPAAPLRCEGLPRGVRGSGRGSGAPARSWRRTAGHGPGVGPRRAPGDGECGGAQGRTAGSVLAATAEYPGAGIAGLVDLFNPERIVLGGWAGLLLGPRLRPAVREAAEAYALSCPAARTAVELGRLGPGAVTVGAATLPLRRFLDAGGSAPPGVAMSARTGNVLHRE